MARAQGEALPLCYLSFWLSGVSYSSIKRPTKDRERPAVAFTAAPSERARTVAQITTNHSATQFSDRVRFNTPDTQTLDARATVDIAHATPARIAQNRRIKAPPARFDPVQVETDGDGIAG